MDPRSRTIVFHGEDSWNVVRAVRELGLGPALRRFFVVGALYYDDALRTLLQRGVELAVVRNLLPSGHELLRLQAPGIRGRFEWPLPSGVASWDEIRSEVADLRIVAESFGLSLDRLDLAPVAKVRSTIFYGRLLRRRLPHLSVVAEYVWAARPDEEDEEAFRAAGAFLRIRAGDAPKNGFSWIVRRVVRYGLVTVPFGPYECALRALGEGA